MRVESAAMDNDPNGREKSDDGPDGLEGYLRHLEIVANVVVLLMASAHLLWAQLLVALGAAATLLALVIGLVVGISVGSVWAVAMAVVAIPIGILVTLSTREVGR